MSSHSSSGEVRGSGFLYLAMVAVTAVILAATIWSPAPQGSVHHAGAVNEQVVASADRSAS